MANMKFKMNREDEKKKKRLPHQTGGKFYTNDAPLQ